MICTTMAPPFGQVASVAQTCGQALVPELLLEVWARHIVSAVQMLVQGFEQAVLLQGLAGPLSSLVQTFVQCIVQGLFCRLGQGRFIL